MFDALFSVLSDCVTTVLDYFTSAFTFVVSIPFKIFGWIIDFFVWLKVESYNMAIEFFVEQLKMLSDFYPDFQFDEDYFITIMSQINIFFPVDDLLMTAVFLLETWVSVKLFKLCAWVGIKYIMPKLFFK